MRRVWTGLTVLLILFSTAGSSTRDYSKKKQDIANVLFDMEPYGGDLLGYSREILGYLEKVEKIVPEKNIGQKGTKRSTRPAERRGEVDYFSLLSGGLAIRESLQLETIIPGDEKGGTVKISTLKGPTVKSHPFGEMLRGREFRYSPLADSCPEDFYYFHFTNLPAALDFFDYLGEVGGSLYRRMSPQSVDFMLKEKILTQLALREDKAARSLYQYVIDEMAITGSDPFLIEGSDVSLLFKIREKRIFHSSISGHRDYYRKKLGARESEVLIEGVRASHLYRDDRKVCSYYFSLSDGTGVISNSRKAAERIIRAHGKREKALSGADDFRYMRTIYPLDPRKEDGFLYLSDSFIRRLVGPEMRIKEARRMHEAARMARLEKYIIYYFELTGVFPVSVNDIYDVLKEGEGSPVDGEGMGPYFTKRIFDGLGILPGTFSATSRAYGRNGYMIPNLEFPIDFVTDREASLYSRFLEEYSSYWRKFFDPIGIRVRLHDGIRVDTCILPLIDNSIYNRLALIAGGTPADIDPSETVSGDVFSLALKINDVFLKETGLDKELRELMSSDPALGNLSVNDIFKGEVRLHMSDTLPLVDFDGSMVMREMMRDGGMKPDIFLGFLVWSLFHPVRISIPVKDSGAALSLVRSLDLYIDRINRIKYMDLKTYTYDYGAGGHEIKVIKISVEDILTFRLYLAVRDDAVHIASTEEYLKRVLDSKGSRRRIRPEHKSNAAARYRPAGMVLERDIFRANIMEAAQAQGLRNLCTMKLLSRLFPGQEDLQGLSLGNFGFKPVCPMGGNYILEKNGDVISTVFGTMDKPAIRFNRVEPGMFRRYFSTEEIMLDLQFTPEGIMTEIRTK